ncbi:MAG: hypothetical protein U5S82_15555 [Gammaproteobacteria bacterium]|nr:hypothetical protein [Gammaproteobacteria bacterium]
MTRVDAGQETAAVCTAAHELVEKGRALEAAELLGRALATSPGEPRLLRWLGRAYLAAGLPELAARYLEEALQGMKGGTAPAHVTAPESEQPHDPYLRLIEQEDQQIRARRRFFGAAELEEDPPAASPGTDSSGEPARHLPATPLPLPARTPSFSSIMGKERKSRPPSTVVPFQGELDLTAGISAGPGSDDTDQLDLIEETIDHSAVEDLLAWEPATDDAGGAAEAMDELSEEDEDLTETADSLAGGAVDVDEDWADFALAGADPEEAPTREEVLAEVRTGGRLSRAERARQVAIKVGLRFDWDEEDIELLTEVFTLHWWSAARVAMERELTAGMTPAELWGALQCREIWRSRPAFATDLGYRYSWLGQMTGTAWPIYRNLDWPTALALVRAFGGDIEPAEVATFLDDLYDRWYSENAKTGMADSFYKYLQSHVGRSRGSLRDWPGWSFEQPEWDPWNEAGGGQTGYSTREYRWLAENNLIPDLLSSSLPLSAMRFPDDIGGDE